jgi:hypothetical protein
MSAMLPHLINLLARSWDLFLHAIGTTGLGWWVQGIILFFATEIVTYLVVWKMRGKDAMKARAAENFKIGLYVWAIVVVCVYGPIFSWDVVRTVYGDHQLLVIQNQQLREQSQGCWLGNLGMKPPSYLPPGAKSGNAIVFFCGIDYDAPLSITWEFDKPINSISTPFFPSTKAFLSNIQSNERSAWAFVQMPSLLHYQTTALLVYGNDAIAPIATKVTLRMLHHDGNTKETVIRPGG